MATVNNFFEQTLLSQAAYSSNLEKGMAGETFPGYVSKLVDGGMSPEQAKAFANQYTVIDQYTDPVSGFSATLFQDVSGQQCLAIRGTQTDLGFIMDGITDVGVFLGLNGAQQYQQLQTFYQALVASGDIQPGSLNVTGHSLGGLLAQMFAVDHPEDVTQTVTFNAPGVGGIGAQLLDLVGIIPESVPANIINVIADPGWSVTAGLGMMLGDVNNVFIEDSGVIAGNLLVENHSIVKLTDSLAVYNLLASIDSSLSIEAITGILQASANKTENSLESAVSSLGELLVDGFTPRTGSEYDSNRDDLYKDVQSVTAAVSSLSNLEIKSLETTDSSGDITPLSSAQIETLAKSDIAYRYALVNLNPFAVVGADYSNFNPNGELDIFDPTEGTGELSEMYLSDRAAMLNQLIFKNIHDGLSESIIRFEDLESGIIVEQISGLSAPQKSIVFGSDDGENIKGTSIPYHGDNYDDHLYGMGGDDTLNGYGGDDILEGGAGSDTMDGGSGNDTFIIHGTDEDVNAYDTFNGGADTDTIQGSTGDDTIRVHELTLDHSIEKIDGGGGDNDIIAGTDMNDTINLSGTQLIGIDRIEGGGGNDTITGSSGADHLLGGADNDTLEGGKGDDILEGGSGIDTYIINSGDGHDTIIDTGRNIIKKDGKTFTGMFTRIEGTNNYTFTSDDSSYTMTFNSPGHLVFDADTSLTFENQISAEDFSDNSFGFSLKDTPMSSVTEITGTADDNFFDFIGSNEPSRIIKGLEGRDYLDGTFEDDVLDGGAGDDWLHSHGGVDTFLGGTGNDLITGMVGGSVASGGSGDDIIVANLGKVFERGGEDNGTIPFDVFWSDMNNHWSKGWDQSLSVGTDGYLQTNWWAGIPNENHSGDSVLGNGWTYQINFEVEPKDVFYFHPNLAPGGILIQNWAIVDVPYSLDEGVTLNGDAGNDLIIGNAGADWLSGGEGADMLFGNSGDDIVTGDSGDDIQIGGAGDDLLDGGIGNDQLWGETGVDILLGRAGDDLLGGGADNDVLYGGSGDDELQGGADNDILEGEAGDDRLFGGDGNDTLNGGNGADSMSGGAGDDTYVLRHGSGIDIIDDHEGSNTICFAEGIELSRLEYMYVTTDGNGVSRYDVTGQDVAILYGDTDSLVLHNGRSANFNFQINSAVYGQSEFMAQLSGRQVYGSGDDTITGTDNDDIIHSGGGDDTVYAGPGNDIISDDNITFIGEPGALPLLHQYFPEIAVKLLGLHFTSFGVETENDDVIYNYDDIIHGGAGDDFLDGGKGNDELWGGSGDDFLLGGRYNDHLEGGAGADRLDGGSGDDHLYGEDGDDILLGGTGDDHLEGGAGADRLEGESGYDYLYGEDGNDILLGGAGGDHLEGGSGDDRLIGGAGWDHLYGGLGNDLLSGGDDRDWIYGEDGNDILLGGAGDDFLDGGDGADVLDGGDGIDGINYRDSTGGVTVNLVTGVASGGDAEGDTLVSIENIGGSSYNDILIGNDKNNSIFGYYGGDDVIYGNDGDDRLSCSGLGNDIIYGGDGNDYISDDGGANQIFGDAGDDIINMSVYDGCGEGTCIYGGEGNDVLYGGNSLSVMDGGEGNDTLYGTESSDILRGGEGDDTLYSWGCFAYDMPGVAIDMLEGGIGNDTYIVYPNMNNNLVYNAQSTILAQNSIGVISDQEGINTIQFNPLYPSIPVALDDLEIYYFTADLNDINTLINDDTFFDYPKTQLHNYAELIHNYAGGSSAGEGGFSIAPDGSDLLIRYAENDALIILGGRNNLNFNFDFGNGNIYDHTTILDHVTIVEPPVPQVEDYDLNLLEDQSLAGTIELSGSSDGIVFTIEQNSANGTFTLNTDGSWDYQPSENYHGGDSVVVNVTNSTGGTASSTINLTIASVNDAPVIEGSEEPYQVLGTLVQEGNLSASDVDGDVLTYAVDTLPEHGSLAINDAAHWIYTAEDGYCGADTAVVAVDDGNGGIATTTLNFAVNVYHGGDLTIEGNGSAGLLLDGASQGDLQMIRQGDDLHVTVGDQGTVTLKDYFTTAENGIDWLQTADGPVYLAKDAIQEGGNSWWPVEWFSGQDSVNDLLSGTWRSDFMFGLGGNDILFGGDGIDLLNGNDGDDTLVGGDGYDLLDGGNGSDTLFGDDGWDSLNGNSGDDALIGGEGNDLLLGGSGNDRLWGDRGNDILSGGTGNDTYTFNLGDGSDTLYDESGIDTITFSADVLKGEIALFKTGTTMKIGYGTDDLITMNNYADSETGNRVETITLADGSTMTDADINQLIQEMSAYATTEGISLNSIDDVKQQEPLMAMIADTWHAA